MNDLVHRRVEIQFQLWLRRLPANSASKAESSNSDNQPNNNCAAGGNGMLSKLARLVAPGLLVIALLLGTACGRLDPYATKFPQVGLGDDRARVVNLMGQPDCVNSVEVPLLKAEQWVWRAPGKGRVYIVMMTMDRTVAKLSVD